MRKQALDQKIRSRSSVFEIRSSSGAESKHRSRLKRRTIKTRR